MSHASGGRHRAACVFGSEDAGSVACWISQRQPVSRPVIHHRGLISRSRTWKLFLLKEPRLRVPTRLAVSSKRAVPMGVGLLRTAPTVPCGGFHCDRGCAVPDAEPTNRNWPVSVTSKDVEGRRLGEGLNARESPTISLDASVVADTDRTLRLLEAHSMQGSLL